MKPLGPRKHLIQAVERKFPGYKRLIESILPGELDCDHDESQFSRLSGAGNNRQHEALTIADTLMMSVWEISLRRAEMKITRPVAVISCFEGICWNAADHIFQQGLVKVASIAGGTEAKSTCGDSKTPPF